MGIKMKKMKPARKHPLTLVLIFALMLSLTAGAVNYTEKSKPNVQSNIPGVSVNADNLKSVIDKDGNVIVIDNPENLNITVERVDNVLGIVKEEEEKGLPEIDWEPKKYINANIDDDFYGNSVVIVLDKSICIKDEIMETLEYPFLLFEHSIEEMSDLKNISSLFQYRTPVMGPNGVFIRQIISVILPIDDKQSVLDAIDILMEIDGILVAEPNYRGYGWD